MKTECVVGSLMARVDRKEGLWAQKDKEEGSLAGGEWV